MQFLQGTEVATGTAGVSASSTTFTDATSGAFADLTDGDTIYIDGHGTYTVTVVDDNEVTLNTATTSPGTSIHWRAVQNPIDTSDIVYLGARQMGAGSGFELIYKSTSFKVR